jgi:hypothetical protein
MTLLLVDLLGASFEKLGVGGMEVREIIKPFSVVGPVVEFTLYSARASSA